MKGRATVFWRAMEGQWSGGREAYLSHLPQATNPPNGLIRGLSGSMKSVNVRIQFTNIT